MAVIEGCKRQKIPESSDRISQLPDNILLDILSYLPTKDAVSTSVLATRWRYLWKSLHNLYFFDEYFDHSLSETGSVKQFSDFVDNVLQLHDASNILQFCLGCRELDCELDSNKFCSWMSTLVSRNVQDVVIYIQKPHPVVFPSSFFSCQSLRTLRIDVAVTIDIPAFISLPRLEELRLQRISLSVEQSIQEVSLNLPMLDELVLQNCLWMDVKTVNIYAPILQLLEISDCKDIGVLDCELRFYAENLKAFKLESSFPYIYSLHQESLFAAFIDITSRPITFNRVSSLFQEISNVKAMELTAFSVETMSYPGVAPHMVMFSNLIYLRVIPGVALAEIDERQMICILSNMPKLASISFPDGLCDFAVRGRHRKRRTTPGSFLSNLHLVDVQGFSGNYDELWFMRFLLKKAGDLLHMTIKFGGSQWQSFSEKEKKKVTKRSQKLGRGLNCRIEIT